MDHRLGTLCQPLHQPFHLSHETEPLDPRYCRAPRAPRRPGVASLQELSFLWNPIGPTRERLGGTLLGK